NDYIHVPVARKVVEIRGAVIRPMAYELLEGDNLSRLVEYAGGAKANAYLTDVQVTRYLQDRRIVANVNLRELSASGGDYVLLNGAVVSIRAVETEAENIVAVKGAVGFPGEYAWREHFRLVELLNQCVLGREARLDFAYLLRDNADGAYRYQFVNIEDAMARPGSDADLILGRGDQLEVLSLKTYASEARFSVVGSVRAPQVFPFNPDGGVRVSDAIQMAGGLALDAADAA